MEPSLIIVGVSHRTAPLDVRERFRFNGSQRRQALAELARADGTEEVLLLATDERTEFILWTHDASASSASVLNLLTRDYNLALCEWKVFYRKLDEGALAHLFLVTAGLDSLCMREHECGNTLKEASTSAFQTGTLGRFLDAAVQASLAISAKLHSQANRAGMDEAEAFAAREAKTIYSRLLADRVVPTIVALRKRLDDICLKELESFYSGLSSLSNDEREKVEAFAARLTQRIAGTLAHELKEPCEKAEQERLTSAVQRLFHLEKLQQVRARAEN